MIVGPDQAPPVGGMGGSIHSWERSTSPWHFSAFPREFWHAAPEKGPHAVPGWAGLDAFGNEIAFVHDGTPLGEGTE